LGTVRFGGEGFEEELDIKEDILGVLDADAEDSLSP
jgi:hypothetical protein